mmetsp:Transcript_27676/g.75016  ORF Transcript_27676/g.75016 Transcript_27676/m.75016 type:complete len:132 (-) Transcript_27676:61-456(-)
MTLCLSSPGRGHWGSYRPFYNQSSSGGAAVSPLISGHGLFSHRRRPAGGGGIFNTYTLDLEDPPVKGHKFRQLRKVGTGKMVFDREAEIRFMLLPGLSPPMAGERVPSNCQMQVWRPQGDFFFWERAKIRT